MRVHNLERELAATRHELNHSLDIFRHAIRIIDKDFTVYRINRAFTEIYGIAREAAVGRKCWEVFPSSRCHTVDCQLVRIIGGENTVQTEIDRVIKDGRTVPCLITTMPMRDQSGVLTGIIEEFSDMSELRCLESQVREYADRYSALINLGNEAGEAVIMLQDVGGIEGAQTFASAQWLRITGYSRDELVGKSFFSLLDEGDREQSVIRHRQKIAGDRVPGLFEVTVVRKDGARVPVEITGAFSIYNGKKANVVYARDITQRKEADEAVKSSEQLYRTIFATAGSAMAIVEEDGTVSLVNNEWEKLSGYSTAESLGKKSLTFIAPSARERIRKYHQKRMEKPHAVPSTYQTLWLTKQGRIKNVIVRVAMIPGTRRRIVSAIDITDLKDAQSRLKRSEKRLRLLSQRSMRAHEDERSRIARELHDQLSQELAALRMYAVSLSGKPEDFGLRVSEIVASADKLLDTVRSISSSLRPKMLDELGLLGALEWYICDFQDRTGIECRLHAHNVVDAAAGSKETGIAAYRIVQEAVLNSLLHASASRIDIYVAARRGKLTVSVSDNGIGFEAGDIKGKPSIGILGMKERALLAGGSLSIRKGKKGGTLVTARLPLAPETG